MDYNSMENNQEREFQRSLEPDVIINDEGCDEDDEDDEDEHIRHNNILAHQTTRPASETDLMHENNSGPDISIIPVINNKLSPTASSPPPHLKLRLFNKEYSPTTKEHNQQHKDKKSKSVIRSPKGTVRIVTKEEIERTLDTYNKRKSLPLEKCKICKKFFRRMKTHLLKHENVKHDPNDPLTCNYCMKSFNTQSNLLIHMRTHTGDKPYICDICHKGFAQSCNLVNHLRIHTGERPFKCPHCERAFTQSGNLNNHIRLHTDEKPFKCHFCDKAFVQSGNLNSHIRNNHKIINNFNNGNENNQTDNAHSNSKEF